MITDYTYIPEVSEASESKVKSTGKISKGLKRLFIIAGILLAAELIWLFGISPFIPFSTIEVHSFDAIQRNDVLMLAGVDDTSSFYSTNINEVREKVSAHILVESAMVIKRFPDKISIFLTPRMPSAVALTIINERQSLVYVDRHGVFFKTEERIPKDLNIPIISGIENPQIYMRLPDSLVTLTESLSVIQSSSPGLLLAISEIRVEHKAWEGFELVLYPVHSSIKVRVENNITEDMLRYILLILNVFESNSLQSNVDKPEEIDFRSGIGSYRIRELSL